MCRMRYISLQSRGVGLVRREGRVVGVALRTGVLEVANLAGVEEVGLGGVQVGARGDARGQVRVRQELGAEGDGVEAPGCDALFGLVDLRGIRSDDCAKILSTRRVTMKMRLGTERLPSLRGSWSLAILVCVAENSLKRVVLVRGRTPQ